MDHHLAVQLLAEFRANRQEFQRRLLSLPFERFAMPPGPGVWSAHDLVAAIAAWLDEANDRIPRLLAGAPAMTYDVHAFNAAAVARAQDWTPEQTLGAFRRAADRFEAIVADTDPGEIAESPEAVAWLTAMARTAMCDHFADIDRLT